MALGSNSWLKEVKMICMQTSSLYSSSSCSILGCNFAQGAQCGLEIMVIHFLASLLPNNIPVFLSMSYWGCSFNNVLNTEAFSFMLLSLLLFRWICCPFTYNVIVKWSSKMTSPYMHPTVMKSNKSHYRSPCLSRIERLERWSIRSLVRINIKRTIVLPWIFGTIRSTLYKVTRLYSESLHIWRIGAIKR